MKKYNFIDNNIIINMINDIDKYSIIYKYLIKNIINLGNYESIYNII